jgi:hypothetical protein
VTGVDLASQRVWQAREKREVVGGHETSERSREQTRVTSRLPGTIKRKKKEKIKEKRKGNNWKKERKRKKNALKRRKEKLKERARRSGSRWFRRWWVRRNRIEDNELLGNGAREELARVRAVAGEGPRNRWGQRERRATMTEGKRGETVLAELAAAAGRRRRGRRRGGAGGRALTRAVARLETVLLANEEGARFRLAHTDAPDRKVKKRNEKKSPRKRDFALGCLHKHAEETARRKLSGEGC